MGNDLTRTRLLVSFIQAHADGENAKVREMGLFVPDCGVCDIEKKEQSVD